jgi:hypothetical protein
MFFISPDWDGIKPSSPFGAFPFRRFMKIKGWAMRQRSGFDSSRRLNAMGKRG